MSPHPSLSLPFVAPDPMRPVRSMGPYELCWCRSGKKYKWCHFRREQQKPITIFEVEAQMLNELRDGYCSYPNLGTDPCSPILTKAHTVQRRGGLAAIAEGGHVLTVKPTMKSLIETDGNPSPRSIGVNKASVFPGFCNKHDSSIFKPIEEKTIDINSDTAFLLAYRAVAYERFAKDAQRRGTWAQREMDRGHPFEKQAEIQMYLDAVSAGIEFGMHDVDRWKREFDTRLLSGSRDGFHYFAVKFDSVLPTVACTAFHPEYDFKGNALQKLGRRGSDFDHITLTVTAFEGNSVAVFGWIGDLCGPAGELAESFSKIDDYRNADALTRLLFVHTDNIFIQPNWWSALSPDDRLDLQDLVKSGTPMRARTGRDLVDDGKSLVNARAIEKLQG